MLVLTRRIHEEILIGDQITVTVLDVGGNHVRLGITAPPDVLVHRAELRQRLTAAELAQRSAHIQDEITAARGGGGGN
jgi:carbon storage regulator